MHYATSSDPLGPWRDRRVLLSKVDERGILGTGHHSITVVPGSDDGVIAYHRFVIPRGSGSHRELCFGRLHHGAAGLLEPVVQSTEPLCLPLTRSRIEGTAGQAANLGEAR